MENLNLRERATQARIAFEQAEDFRNRSKLVSEISRVFGISVPFPSEEGEGVVIEEIEFHYGLTRPTEREKCLYAKAEWSDGHSTGEVGPWKINDLADLGFFLQLLMNDRSLKNDWQHEYFDVHY